MCYMVYISTDCADDLSCRSSELVRFREPSAETWSPCPRILKHEHRWFVGSQSGCSCTFRHLSHGSIELGFGPPEEWFPEDQDEIDATRQLHDILRGIVQRGRQVDLLDCWSGDEEEDAVALDVSLTVVPVEHFRLFEGYVFTMKP